MDRKQSKQKIEKLVQTFQREVHEKINEAETRLRFIDPFFEALGWDIRDPREVRVESALAPKWRTSGLARSEATRPDYRFLIDGKTRFFVEAKKPAVKLTDPAPIFQAKSYGFSSKVPLVILTDFEEFRPFRTLARPKFDRPLGGLIKEFDFTYDRYVDEFDTLYDAFSREAVAAGELEKRIPTEKKEASATVDKEFLNDLSKWQEELAKNIALRNSKLTVAEINEAVQRILDRIIFLRICEDRQIEEGEILLSYADKEEIYPKLLKEFTRLRSKYNGLIFNEHTLSEQLSIDDKLLKEIIKNLYLPHSPYRFNEIPIEILGTIYEQYLGKVITLTPSHRAKVEVKPEVRKAGGVFYTPQFITSYIVKNTIGRLLQPCEGSRQPDGGQAKPSEGLSPEQIAKLRFADIACGSGSFLLEMFDYLIRYHIDYYSANPSKIKTVDGVPDAFQTSDGLWHLSTRKKKEILVNNIYGVDIDPQAVEVTQMSLYLKLLEGESAETFGKQLTLELKETILPNLSNNIKCGNSLVGMDIKGLGNTLSLEEELRIRPFDWETAFPEVMKSGGFDAIVGNPPYVDIKGIPWDDRRYYEDKYPVKGRFDLYVLFVLKAMQISKENGYWAFIIPNKFATNLQFDEIRKTILLTHQLNSVLAFEGFQFKAAGVNSIVICCNKKKPSSRDRVRFLEWAEGEMKFIGEQRQLNLISNQRFNFVFVSESGNKRVVDKIRSSSKTYKDFFNVRDGIVAGGIKDKLFSERRTDSDSQKLFFGRGLKRYSLEWTGTWVNYKPQEMMQLEIRRKGKKRPGLWMREEAIFQKPKILTRKVGTHIIVTLDEQGIYFEQTLHGSLLRELNNQLNIRYFLGILNSNLMKFYYRSSVQQEGKLFPQVRIRVLESLPIRTIDFTNPDEKAVHDRMVQLVERMLDLHKKKHQAKADSEKELFEHQIKATDKEIDEMVYRLYGLTEQEIAIVEAEP